MGRILVIGASGTIGQAAVEALRGRHEVVCASAHRSAHQLDATQASSVEALYKAVGRVDGVVVALGGVHFGELDTMTPAQFLSGLQDKLMAQVQCVLLGQPWMNDGGSFTLTSGITAHCPIRTGTNASAVNMALEGFVRGAAVDLARGMRINLVSPTVLEASAALYAPYFPGFEPVSAHRVGLAYVRSVDGGDTGQVYRVGY